MNFQIDPFYSKPTQIRLTNHLTTSFIALELRFDRTVVSMWFPPETFKPLIEVVKSFNVPYKIQTYTSEERLVTIEEKPDEKQEEKQE